MNNIEAVMKKAKDCRLTGTPNTALGRAHLLTAVTYSARATDKWLR